MKLFILISTIVVIYAVFLFALSKAMDVATDDDNMGDC